MNVRKKKEKTETEFVFRVPKWGYFLETWMMGGKIISERLVKRRLKDVKKNS